jgi:hypothetical protein
MRSGIGWEPLGVVRMAPTERNRSSVTGTGTRKRQVPRLVLVIVWALALTAGILSNVVGSANAGTVNNCWPRENGDPVVDALTVTPDAVDVRSGPQSVTVSVDAHDTGGPGAGSGVAHVVAVATAPGGEARVSTRLRLSAGQWAGTLVIPQWSRSGTWTLAATVTDHVGWSRIGVPTQTIHVTSTPDTRAPTLSSIAITPGRVNTKARPRLVHFTTVTRDTQSGTRRVGLELVDDYEWLNVAMRRVATNTFRGSLRVRKWRGARDTIRIVTATLTDAVGNTDYVSAAQLRGVRGPKVIRVVSNAETRRPAALSFRLTPSSVDLRAADQTVEITVKARDRRSGVRDVSVAFYTGEDHTFDMFTFLHRVSGTARRGTWKGTVTARRCWNLPPGSYYLALNVVDRAENLQRYYQGQLTRHGWPRDLPATTGDRARPEYRETDGTGQIDLGGPLEIHFLEAVNGIDTSSAVVTTSSGAGISGLWQCFDAAEGQADCLTGEVFRAAFTPQAPFEKFGAYDLILNPEHSLQVVDLAGNPFLREQVWYSVR